LATGVVLIALGLLAQYSYYGDLIPASVRGKLALPRSLLSVWSLALFPIRDPLQIVLTISAFIGLPAAWRASRFVRIYSAWALALLLTWIVTGAHLWPWYCVPFWFFKILVTSVALDAYLERYAQLALWIRPTALASIAVLAWVVFAAIYGRDRMETNVYRHIRQWAAGKNFNGQSAYAMDFGALGYYTGLRILDEPGLAWPAGRENYGSDLTSILIGEKPQWAFVTRCGDNMRYMQSDKIMRLYEPVWRASIQGDISLEDTNEQLEPWAADFVLYRRITDSP